VDPSGFGIVQLAHVPPSLPQTVSLVVVVQVPLLQQPPLQAKPPAHECEHCCVPVLHAEPLGQSVESLQPQPDPPATH
jgi:hypothetical protein